MTNSTAPASARMTLVESTVRSNQSPSDSIRQVDDFGVEFWSARDLMGLLAYVKWQNVESTMERSVASLKASGHNVFDHVTDSSKLIEAGKGAKRKVFDYRLSRFGCYMFALNGDPTKPEIAAAQSYFVSKAREAETAIPAIAKPTPKPPALEISSSFITEAIDAVLKGTDIHPSLIAGVKANRIADRFPALKGDMEAVKRLLPVAVDEQLLTVTALADMYFEKWGDRCSAQRINIMLRDAGLQIKGMTKDNPWLPTESGKVHSQMVLQTASGRDKTVYQLRWKPSVLNRLNSSPQSQA